MGNETLDVLCFVFPSGETFFLPLTEFNQSDPHKVMDAWKALLSPDKRQRYVEADVTGGFVWTHMLKEDYDRLPPSDLAKAITQQLEAA